MTHSPDLTIALSAIADGVMLLGHAHRERRCPCDAARNCSRSGPSARTMAPRRGSLTFASILESRVYLHSCVQLLADSHRGRVSRLHTRRAVVHTDAGV